MQAEKLFKKQRPGMYFSGTQPTAGAITFRADHIMAIVCLHEPYLLSNTVKVTANVRSVNHLAYIARIEKVLRINIPSKNICLTAGKLPEFATFTTSVRLFLVVMYSMLTFEFVIKYRIL